MYVVVDLHHCQCVVPRYCSKETVCAVRSSNDVMNTTRATRRIPPCDGVRVARWQNKTRSPRAVCPSLLLLHAGVHKHLLIYTKTLLLTSQTASTFKDGAEPQDNTQACVSRTAPIIFRTFSSRVVGHLVLCPAYCTPPNSIRCMLFLCPGRNAEQRPTVACAYGRKGNGR